MDLTGGGWYTIFCDSKPAKPMAPRIEFHTLISVEWKVTVM